MEEKLPFHSLFTESCRSAATPWFDSGLRPLPACLSGERRHSRGGVKKERQNCSNGPTGLQRGRNLQNKTSENLHLRSQLEERRTAVTGKNSFFYFLCKGQTNSKSLKKKKKEKPTIADIVRSVSTGLDQKKKPSPRLRRDRVRMPLSPRRDQDGS